MNLSLFNLTCLFLFYLPIQASLASSRHHYHQSPNSENLKSLSGIKNAPSFWEGCTAILEGLDNLNDNHKNFEHFFATWENDNLDMPFLNFFDNHYGIVAKLWNSNYDWRFELRIFDGNYIDQKFAKIQCDLWNTKTTVLQYNGTFQTDNVTLTIEYGTNYKSQFSKTITGQFFFYFVNRDTQRPITEFDESNTNIQGDTVQIMFISSDGKNSLKTSFFAKDSPMSTLNKVVSYLFPVLYLIFIIPSFYSQSLSQQISLGSMQAAYIYASFMLVWFAYQPYFYGLFYFLFVMTAVVDFFKCFHFIIAGAGDWGNVSYCGIIGVSCSVFLGALNLIPSIWINLIPCFLHIGPLLQKIRNRKYGFQNYITKLELSNWGCMCLWMAYAHVYPGNFFLFSFKPLLASLFFSIILLQLLIALIMQKRQQQQHNDSLLQEEQETDQALPQTNNEENSPKQSKKRTSLDIQ